MSRPGGVLEWSIEHEKDTGGAMVAIGSHRDVAGFVEAGEQAAYHCGWDQDLADAGVEPTRPKALNVGVPAFVLAMLAAALLVAFLAPDPGRGPAPLGIALLVAACAPWVPWLLHGDDGPTWSFIAFAMTPVALLGVGHWFVESLGLGSAAAYPLLAFPGLLLAVLGIAVAQPAMATGIGVATWMSFGGPLVAAWFAGRDVAASDLVTWQVVMALGLISGYAVRFTYRANAAVVAAREALAWQAAADQRRQAARDVHDVVAHTLAVTMLHVTAARMAVIRGSPEVAVDALEEAERQGRSSLADIRRIVRLLRAEDGSTIDAVQPGLADIDALVARYQSGGLDVELALPAVRRALPATTELALYRVLQEALTNAARHGAGTAGVAMSIGDAAVTLRVENPLRRSAAPSQRGSGLTGMRERIAAAGGTIEAGVRDGRWVVVATVPDQEAA